MKNKIKSFWNWLFNRSKKNKITAQTLIEQNLLAVFNTIKIR